MTFLMRLAVGLPAKFTLVDVVYHLCEYGCQSLDSLLFCFALSEVFRVVGVGGVGSRGVDEVVDSRTRFFGFLGVSNVGHLGSVKFITSLHYG